MHFIAFVLFLLLVGIAFTWLFSLCVGPIIILVGKTENKIVMGFLFVLGFFVQAFLILGWDAYAVSKTVLAMHHQTVQHPWLYVAFGFLATIAPLGYMASQEPPEPGGAPALGSCIFLLLAIVGFWVFYLYPPLMFTLYGWFLNWWFS